MFEKHRRNTHALRLQIISITLLAVCVLPASADPISSTWSRAAVKIEIGQGSGSGFLIRRAVDSSRSLWKLYLVTNKHVIMDKASNKLVPLLTLQLNAKDKDGRPMAKTIFVSLQGITAAPLSFHPTPEVDIAAVDITVEANLNQDLDYLSADYDHDLITQEEIEKYKLTAGYEVLVIGYPLGLPRTKLNKPLVCQGIIASDYTDDLKGQNGDELPACIVDSNVIPGSSGSAVSGGEKALLLG